MQQLKGLSSVKFYEYKKLASDFGVSTAKAYHLGHPQYPAACMGGYFCWIFLGGVRTVGKQPAMLCGAFAFLNAVGEQLLMDLSLV